MKNMFKREHVIETGYDNAHYLRSFFDAYQLTESLRMFGPDRIVYRIDMTKREFAALCEYLNDLGKMGVYPILL